MPGLLQAKVSIKRLGDFLQYKDLDENNVVQYPQSEETGNSSVVFLLNNTMLTGTEVNISQLMDIIFQH